MDKALSYYIKRNAEIVRDFISNEMPVFALSEKYHLKEQRIKQILRAAGMSTLVAKDGPKTPYEILRSLRMSKDQVQGALLRAGVPVSEVVKGKLNYEYK